MKISADWLNKPSTRLVMERLVSRGYQAYFVGGCVRNTLLNIEATDIDIATSAHPTKVLEIMENAELKALPTGIEHGTVTVVSDKRN